MLIVTRLKLSNICQYDEIDVPIATGLMAVCGRNGSGKSTLLRGLMYGLTGLVDGSWGTQANLQKDGCAVPGYVGVTLRDDRTSKEYIIKRYATAGAKFADTVTEFYEGAYKEVATRRKTVDAYLSELYGIPVQLLFQLCWGRQGHLDILLTAPAAYVSTFLSSVFDMKFLEVLRERLKSALDHIAAYDNMESAIEATRKEQQQLTEWIAEQQEKVEKLDAKLTKLYARRDKLQSSMVDTKDGAIRKTAALEASLTDTLQELEPLDKLMQTPEYEAYRILTVDQVLAGIDEANETIIQAHDDQGEFLATIDTLQEKLNKLMLMRKDIENNLVSYAESLDTVEKARQRLADGVFHNGADSCCLCDHIVENKKAYIQKTLWLVGYQDVEGITDVWDKPFTDEIAELTDKRRASKNALTKLESDVEETTKALSDSKVKLKERKEAEVFADKLLDKFTNVRKWQSLTADKEALEKAIAENSVDAAYSALTKEIDVVANDINTGEGYKQALTSEIVKANAQIEAKEDYITKLQAMQEQADINNAARGMLSLLRDVFSQQRAQARYLAYKSDELNNKLSYFLQQTGMPFSLYLDKDQRVFQYVSEGGFVHPTAHLSGAQKNISAVALQMALVEVISPNINLFLFDEPSESLDVENKIIMAELFKRMNRLLPSIGGTMLIVSRDESLIEACENVINIQQATKEA